MAEFGWAYIDNQSVTGVGGATGSVQVVKDSSTLTGSADFVYTIATSNLALSGTMDVTGSATFNGFAGAQAIGNSSVINYNVNVGENYNSLLLGPITIASGSSITIGANSNIKIKDITDV